VKIDNHINRDLLLAHARRQLNQPDASAVSAHLRDCNACADDYGSILLKLRIKRVAAPEWIWQGIRTAMEESPQCRPSRFGLWPSLAVAALILVVCTTGYFRFRADRTQPFDVGQYLYALEVESTGPNPVNMRVHFPGFLAYDRQSALSDSQFQPQVQGYRLIEQRILKSGGLQVVQLLYDSGSDSFIVFIAPRKVIFNFGLFKLVDDEAQGITCRRAVCPRQDIYQFTTAKRKYVFVHKHNPSVGAGPLFAELMRSAP
jgi:hypothetical protein